MARFAQHNKRNDVKYFRYHNTNCFFIENDNNELLAIDVGWPCTFYEYARLVKSIGLKFKQIKWAVVTHFHMDHAGLLSEFIDQGIKCIIFENQEDAIDEMEKTIYKNYGDYKSINRQELIHWDTINSKASFESIGIKGCVVITNGHSKDSISFITNSYEAIIGDLYPLEYVMGDDFKSIESYNILRSKNVKYILPSHAQFFEL